MHSERVCHITITTAALILLLLLVPVDQIAATTMPSSTTGMPSRSTGDSSPQLTLIPSSGSVGDLVTVAGSGFVPDQIITFRIDGNVILVYQTGWDGRVQVLSDPSGGFGGISGASGSALTPSVRFTIPTLTGGTHTISAEDDTGNVAKATLTVTARVIVSPVTGPVGTHVRVYGTGLKPEIPVTITLDNTPLQGGIVITDAAGLFSTTIEVPVTHKGIYTIKVNDGVVTTEFRFVVEGEAPPAPNLRLPSAGSVTKQPVHFTWEAMSDPSGITYELQVSADPEFARLLLDKTGLASAEYMMTEAEQLGLSGNGRIFNWRVRAVDGIGNSGTWSVVWTFNIGPTWPAWVTYIGYGLGISVIVIAGFWLYRSVAKRPDR